MDTTIGHYNTAEEINDYEMGVCPICGGAGDNTDEKWISGDTEVCLYWECTKCGAWWDEYREAKWTTVGVQVIGRPTEEKEESNATT